MVVTKYVNFPIWQFSKIQNAIEKRTALSYQDWSLANSSFIIKNILLCIKYIYIYILQPKTFADQKFLERQRSCTILISHGHKYVISSIFKVDFRPRELFQRYEHAFPASTSFILLYTFMECKNCTLNGFYTYIFSFFFLQTFQFLRFFTMFPCTDIFEILYFSLYYYIDIFFIFFYELWIS